MSLYNLTWWKFTLNAHILFASASAASIAITFEWREFRPASWRLACRVYTLICASFTILAGLSGNIGEDLYLNSVQIFRRKSPILMLFEKVIVFRFFYSDSHRDNSENTARFTLSDIHAGIIYIMFSVPQSKSSSVPLIWRSFSSTHVQYYHWCAIRLPSP